MAKTAQAKTSPVIIALAWILVGLPWLWGITKTLQNAANLFH
jgi:hypothetical protein